MELLLGLLEHDDYAAQRFESHLRTRLPNSDYDSISIRTLDSSERGQVSG